MKKFSYIFLLLSLALNWNCNMFAQVRTVEIVKGGQVVYSSPASEIEYMTVMNRIPAPGNLRGTASNDKITLQWDAVSGATSYKIFRSADGKNYTQLGTATTTSYVDKSPLSGANYYRVQALGSNGAQSGMSETQSPIIYGALESGMYVGIIGFNDDLNVYPVQLLDKGSKSGFNSFINNLTEKRNTALYYAVENAISTLQANSYPENLFNVSIVTFTDGLDNQSLFFKDFNDVEEYGDLVHSEILQSKVANIPISAYAIGLRSTGIIEETFRSSLEKISSPPNEDGSQNWFVVENMNEVNNKFKEIAQKIYETSTSQNLTITIPAGLSNGLRIRFTFDLPKAGNKTPAQAEGSQVYIEATHYRDGKNRFLRDIKVKGLTLKDVTEMQGILNGTSFDFTFEGITLNSKRLVQKDYIVGWRAVNDQWQYEAEIAQDDQLNLEETKRTAAIVLVLDCTTSLGNLFGDMKSSANNFIETLVKGTESNTGGTTTPDYNNHAYVDLGLPSGLKWATMNVGATSATGYGNYYAWGETTTKNSYSEGTSKWYNKGIVELQEAGAVDANGKLVENYDAANVNWGSTWRIPSVDDCNELINNCNVTIETLNNVKGLRFTSKKNGASIFIPFAGMKNDTSLSAVGTDGYYWTLDADKTGNSTYSQVFTISAGGGRWFKTFRHYGLPIRAVSK